MASSFQAVSTVGALSYPNAIAWSDENLIAIASGHLVTILNPALPLAPRGLVTISTGEPPFTIGVVDRNDLLTACLLPTSLSRDTRPCVRSISWSPIGLAPNAGCLLAVCTTEGRVKLYRPPFCDFCAEWIEVVDVSNRLYEYLASISFGEQEACTTSKTSDEHATENRLANEDSDIVLRRGRKRRKAVASRIVKDSISDEQDDETGKERQELSMVLYTGTAPLKVDNSKRNVSASKSKAKPRKKIPEHSTQPLITADKYASRSSMLSSLVVAWSPVLQLTSKTCSIPQNGSSVSLLAVGGKSGQVSIWRVSVPNYFSIEHGGVPTTATIVALLQAHHTWITAISWALLDSDSSNPHVLLATGSTDGSVKIWLAYNEQLLKSTESNHASFSLLEVIAVDNAPVSVLSLAMPDKFSDKILLAIGKVSGSSEVWICDVSSSKFDKVGLYEMHDHVVTGLAWAFDGRSLYSCSQDNFVRSWILSDGVLREVPIPSNTPRLRSSTDLPDAYISCLGLAVSPGNLVIAMVRNFDQDLLDPMYQQRTQKAAVDFFWIGAQQVNPLSDFSPDVVIPGFPGKELVCWELNILWSLKQYENQNKPLVVWDIVAALLAFKCSSAKYVEHVLVKWLSISFVGSQFQMGLSAEKILPHVSKSLSKLASRQLHLLNIICRRVILSELKPEQINCKEQNLQGLDCTEEEKLMMWIELLLSSERELRERLVGLSFSAFTSLSLRSHSTTVSSQPGDWFPVGLAQMEQWVSLNRDVVQDQLRVLAIEVGKHKERLQLSGNASTEKCSYCSSSVPFESSEVAFCQGVGHGHKLARCAVSMEVCPLTPLWFCMSCHRQVFRLPPETLFALPEYPVDFKSSATNICSKPLCPFCGILLQRLQPDFLLSASPV
ncbi:uncharacterized protein LOC107404763 isoform X2 [Ziziphus jujuba]|uniref:Uncharacterized protein LOC107404763 isoform X2 n=1 Tax=Ziziphus jujuba TaxID=326968 RepID=A0A6P3YU44_ZIZJJ|nr:uncharacterized protein LOC107404763 isoform X2 [Ziziphus jujuba]